MEVQLSLDQTNKTLLLYFDSKKVELPKFKVFKNVTYCNNVDESEREIEELYKRVGSLEHDVFLFVDEYADLIYSGRTKVRRFIVKLLECNNEKVHLLLSSQSPWWDAVTIIKRKIADRFCFYVSNSTCSVSVLGHGGAEKLLGHGDMLYNDSVDEIRAQGAFISSNETNEITDFIKEQCDTNYILNMDDFLQKEESQESMGVDDELFAAVARFVVEENNASINRIQKTFNMGFNKAQAIMEALENLGIVSENLGSRARVVQVGMEQLEEILNNL